MTIELTLYLINLISNIDSILSFLIGVPLITVIISLIVGAYNLIDSNDDFSDTFFEKTLLLIKKYIGWYILIIFISGIFPSEKTMYLMIGANYFKNSALPPKIEMIIEKKLDEYLIDKPRK